MALRCGGMVCDGTHPGVRPGREVGVGEGIVRASIANQVRGMARAEHGRQACAQLGATNILGNYFVGHANIS